MREARVGILPTAFKCDAVEQMYEGVTYSGPKTKYVTWHLSKPCPKERCHDDGGVSEPVMVVIPEKQDEQWTKCVNQELVNIMWCHNQGIPVRPVEVAPAFTLESDQGDRHSLILGKYPSGQYPFSTVMEQQRFYREHPDHQLPFAIDDTQAWLSYMSSILMIHELMSEKGTTYYGVEPVLSCCSESSSLFGYKLINGDVLGKVIPDQGRSLEHLVINGVFPSYNKSVSEDPSVRYQLWQMISPLLKK